MGMRYNTNPNGLKFESITKMLGGKKPTAQNLYIHLMMRNFISNKVKNAQKESK